MHMYKYRIKSRPKQLAQKPKSTGKKKLTQATLAAVAASLLIAIIYYTAIAIASLLATNR